MDYPDDQTDFTLYAREKKWSHSKYYFHYQIKWLFWYLEFINGSKFTLEGIGEALAAETSHLGIKVTNVESGSFRTDWAGRSAIYNESEIDDYNESTAKKWTQLRMRGNQMGDPSKSG